jgi:hypothetical protein
MEIDKSAVSKFNADVVSLSNLLIETAKAHSYDFSHVVGACTLFISEAMSHLTTEERSNLLAYLSEASGELETGSSSPGLTEEHL